MSANDFDDLKACINKQCYCAQFVKGGKGGCPDIKLECWEHNQHTGACHCCVLCDYLNSLHVELWKDLLPAIQCNLQNVNIRVWLTPVRIVNVYVN